MRRMSMYFDKNCGIYVNEQNQYLFGSQTDTSALLGTVQPCPDNLVSTLESWGQNIKAGDPDPYQNSSPPPAGANNIANCKDPTKTCKYTDWITCGNVLADKYRYYEQEVRKMKATKDMKVDMRECACRQVQIL